MLIARRTLITGLASLIAAPAVARFAPLMPVKVWRPAPINLPIVGFLVEGVNDDHSMCLRPVHFPWPMYDLRLLSPWRGVTQHPDVCLGESFTLPNGPTDLLITMGRESLARAKAAGVRLPSIFEVSEIDASGIPMTTYGRMSPF